MRTIGGDVKTCAGFPVALTPKSTYSSEVVDALNAGKIRSMPTNADPRMHGYDRHATCDAQGNFHFDNLPAGDWYAVTGVGWAVVSHGIMENEGGFLTQPVTTTAGQVSEIILAR